jgi:hypothetical protein
MRYTVLLATVLFSALTFTQLAGQSGNGSSPTPLILERNEGEHRIRKSRDTPTPTAPFIMKIDRKNGGSQKMWLGTENIPPGGLIPKHKHLGQDEILFIQTGTAKLAPRTYGWACRNATFMPEGLCSSPPTPGSA